MSHFLRLKPEMNTKEVNQRMLTHNPKRVAAKLQKVVDAWTALRPTKTFSGMTLDQFKAKVQPSLAARDQLVTVQSQAKDNRQIRHDSDSTSLNLAQLVVNSVKGDPDEGESGGLYAAMGYVPKNQRRSGLTRKGQTTTPVTPVAASAATTTATTVK
jgi:hypothetical protein